MAKRFGSGKMLIPKPLDVDALIRKVRKGKHVRKYTGFSNRKVNSPIRI